MMKRAALHFFVIATIIISVIIEAESANSKAVTCNQQGFVCNGCESSYFCIMAGDNSLFPEKIEDCQAGTSCLEETGKCTSDSNPKCDQAPNEYKFTCHQPGMFPDPFNCTKYHICAEDQPDVYKGTEHTCTKGFSYDPNTLSCRKMECNSPLVKCENVGDINSVGDHKTMYYICKSSPGIGLYPDLFRCPGHTVFINGKCGWYDLGLNSNGKCRELGEFYSSEGCTYYNKCYGPGGSVILNRCSCGSKFDGKLGFCVQYYCKYN